MVDVGVVIGDECDVVCKVECLDYFIIFFGVGRCVCVGVVCLCVFLVLLLVCFWVSVVVVL